MKKIASFVATSSFVALLSVGSVSAQVETQSPINFLQPRNIPILRVPVQNTSAERMEPKNTIKSVQENFQSQVKTLNQNSREKMMVATSSAERRDAVKNAFDERKEIIDERRDAVKNALDERKEMIEDRRASTTAVKQRLSVLARQHIGLITQRFSMALKQFDNLTERIQSRIDKLKENGIDTTAADTLFSTAKGAVEQAKTDVRALSDIVAQINDASDVKTVRAQIDAGIKTATTSIKTAHRALVAVANSLMSLVSQNKNPRATSTIENNQ